MANDVPAFLQLVCDDVEQAAIEIARDQLAPEPDISGALERGSSISKATEAPEAHAIIKRPGEPLVGEVVPDGKQQRAK